MTDEQIAPIVYNTGVFFFWNWISHLFDCRPVLRTMLALLNSFKIQFPG